VVVPEAVTVFVQVLPLYYASYSYLGCTNVRAFISVDGSDAIQYMPSNYVIPSNVEIHGPTGKRIGQNWADLLDGSIERTMADADVESSYNYWTGASSNGGSSDVNCTVSLQANETERTAKLSW
jgi:hypothetical protein